MEKPGLIILKISIFVLLMISGCSDHAIQLSDTQKSLQEYNVIWDSPSQDHHGSMPIGNGDIGLNVWVDEAGDLSFYIGKTDSWGDNGILKKVGKIRVRSNPGILFDDSEFKQELDLATGTIRIHSSSTLEGHPLDIQLEVWVDANHPVIHVTHESSLPVELTAEIELWRTEPYSLPELMSSDLLFDESKPGNLHKEVIIEPDVLLENTTDYIGWYHHNAKSVGFDINIELQGLTEFFNEDPILHRTFGAILTGESSTRVDNTTLRTAKANSGRLNVYVLTQHPSDPEAWQLAIEELENEIESISFTERRNSHEQWWAEFWDRSWIHARSSALSENSGEYKSQDESVNAAPTDVEEDSFIISRAYALQRFINAGAGRGAHPIKFNGSIFTVPTEGGPGGPDYRRWGPGYWWMNTRLPYYSMPASGDFEFMQPLFDMYAGQVYEISKLRTEKYFGIDGVYFPETIYFWGSVFTRPYGWTPFEEREDPLQESLWHKWAWTSGPELMFIMLDNYDHTRDQELLTESIIPLANDFLLFFDNHYPVGDNGKWIMEPSQALETWWDTTNPMPEVAGLRSITKRLLRLPESQTTREQRDFWQKMMDKIPDLPVRDTPSGIALAPAERFENKRNIENPELYGVFPFRLVGVGLPNKEWGENALEHRWDSGNSGWRQDDIFMAYLGLADQTRENLVARATNYDENSRFPAFWGPNYDWTPDQTHGGVLMKTFQSMIMQTDPYSDSIYLLPAWPEEWDVDFRLHAPNNTLIEGRVTNGEIESLEVTPSSRINDIVILSDDQ